MTLLTHLIGTDVRRFRLMLAALVVLAAAALGLDIVRPIVSGTSRTLAAVSMAMSLVWFAKIVLTLVAIAAIVHANALVGSDAFWMTRPVPPGVLLASKLILLAAILLVLPVVSEIVLMRLYHVPVRRVVLVAAYSALLQMLWLSVLLSGATLTRNLAGFGLLAGGALVALAASVIVSQFVLMAQLDDGLGFAMLATGNSLLPPDLEDATGTVIFTLGCTAALLALAVTQYFRRARVRALVIGCAGLALTWAVVEIWPWPLLRPRIEVPAWASAPGAPVLSAEPSTVTFSEDGGWSYGQRQWKLGRAQMVLDGVPAGWTARVRLARSTLVLPDGRRFEGRGVPFGDEVPIERGVPSQRRSVLRSVLGVSRAAGFGWPLATGSIVMLMSEAELQAYAGASGTYSGTFFIDLSREEVAATLPLAVGGVFQEGAARFQIDEVRPTAGVTLRVRRSNATTPLSRDGPVFYTYYLRNTSRGEAVTTGAHSLLGESFAIQFGGPSHISVGWASGFFVGEDVVSPTARTIQVATPLVPDDPIDIGREWLAGAELVIVRTTRAGSVERTLEMRGFKVMDAR